MIRASSLIKSRPFSKPCPVPRVLLKDHPLIPPHQLIPRKGAGQLLRKAVTLDQAIAKGTETAPDPGHQTDGGAMAVADTTGMGQAVVTGAAIGAGAAGRIIATEAPWVGAGLLTTVTRRSRSGLNTTVAYGPIPSRVRSFDR